MVIRLEPVDVEEMRSTVSQLKLVFGEPEFLCCDLLRAS